MATNALLLVVVRLVVNCWKLTANSSCVYAYVQEQQYEVRYLPPVVLTFSLPADYPSVQPPQYSISCQWLSDDQVQFDLSLILLHFYQRVSIASYASADIAREGMSVCPSVTLRYCIKTKKASVMIFSPSESPNILVSRNIRFIPKF